jgi:hypothetical protein
MSLANNALYVTNIANYKFNPVNKNTINIPPATTYNEPFQESFTYSDVMLNTDFPVSDRGMSHAKVKGIDECKQNCDNEAKCKGIVLDRRPPQNVCWLKNSIPQGNKLKSVPNVDTYVAYPNYADIIDHNIDPTDNVYDINTNTNGATTTESDIASIQAYQVKLSAENAVKQSLLDETNSKLNYTVMAMTIWVPLGIIAGYYLYKTNVVFSAPGVK